MCRSYGAGGLPTGVTCIQTIRKLFVFGLADHRNPALPLSGMKNVLVYILLIATLLPTVSSWGTIAYYHVNKAYIARVLCENRDKPQLHCDGQCYLAKQLKAQQDRQDKETTERVQNTPVLHLFCQANLPFQFRQFRLALLPVAFSAYQFPAYLAPLSGLFRPPQV